MAERSCHHCGTLEKELRPYGPGGAWVCFPCAHETPERAATAESAFFALVQGSAAVSTTGIVAVGEEEGPRPFDPRELES